MNIFKVKICVLLNRLPYTILPKIGKVYNKQQKDINKYETTYIKNIMTY